MASAAAHLLLLAASLFIIPARPSAGLQLGGSQPVSIASSNSPSPDLPYTEKVAQETPVSPSKSTRQKPTTPIPLEQICGTTPLLSPDAGMRSPRIVGGRSAVFGEFPWQVSLLSMVNGTSQHRCGASLVHPRWIITTAHCALLTPIKAMVARVGEFDFGRTNPDYPYVERRVIERIVHEKFRPDTYENDIALIRLAEPVELAPHIIPLCLAPYKNYTGSYGTISGWGMLAKATGKLAHVLHKADLPFIANSDCEQWLGGPNGRAPQLIDIGFICAGYKNGSQDACQGDSGGPIVQDVDGRWSLVGLISWGKGCGEPDSPGRYTLVPMFTDWIRNATNGDIFMPEFYVRKYGPGYSNYAAAAGAR